MVEFVYEPTQPEWADKVAEAAIASFGLRNATLDFQDHTNNVIYRVEADGPDRRQSRASHALRISKPRADVASLQRENLLLRSICEETDLTAPEPAAGQDGLFVRSVPGPSSSDDRYCTLYKWVDGEFLNEELTVDHIEKVGSYAAILHSHTETFRWPGEISRYDPSIDSKAKRLFGPVGEATFTTSEMAVFKSTMDIIRETAVSLASSDSAIGIVHGDLQQWNYLFHEGEMRAIDFEECRYDYYLYELAVVLSCLERQYPFPSPEREEYPELRMALIDGYWKYRALPDNFEEAIDAFIALRNLVMVDWILGWAQPVPSHMSWGQDYIDGALERLSEFIKR